MFDTSDLLSRLQDCDNQLVALQALRGELIESLKEAVNAVGPVEGYGYRAHYKAGRKSTNHELAATENAAPEDLVLKYTKTKITTTTEWAKVTKDMGVNLTPYTTQSEPTFVVEQVTPF